MKLLITGGAGFIGSALIRRCIKHTDHFVLNLDKLTYAANLDNLREVEDSPRYQFVKADICNARKLADVLDAFEPDAIMHLAAETHVDRSIDGPQVFVVSNVLGTSVLIETARQYWTKLPQDRREAFRFLHISTDEVFGSLGTSGYFTETTPYAPNSPYSASKASSDMLVRAWNRTYGFPVLISNCSNNYGPCQYPEKLLPTVINAAVEGRAIPVYGQGLNVRDWLFVDDHAAALLRVLEAGMVGETYNIGGNAEWSNIGLVRKICAILDEKRPQVAPHDRLITFVTDRPGHDLRYAIDSSKIRNELGWTPSYDIESGLRLTVEWYLANPWWMNALKARGYRDERLGTANPPKA